MWQSPSHAHGDLGQPLVVRACPPHICVRLIRSYACLGEHRGICHLAILSRPVARAGQAVVSKCRTVGRIQLSCRSLYCHCFPALFVALHLGIRMINLDPRPGVVIKHPDIASLPQHCAAVCALQVLA